MKNEQIDKAVEYIKYLKGKGQHFTVDSSVLISVLNSMREEPKD
jgi:hypothetical protein